MSNPIPDKLIRDLARAPLLERPRLSWTMRLSLRERWILLLYAHGYRGRRIRDELEISCAQLVTARRRLRWYYDARSMTDAVSRAMRAGDLA